MPAEDSLAEGLSDQQSLILAEGPISSGLRALVTLEDPTYQQWILHTQRTLVTVEGFVISVGSSY